MKTLKAIGPASEVLVGTIVHVVPGMNCSRGKIVRRLEIEVDEVLRGTYSPGDRIAVLEEGGGFDAQGARFLFAESSYDPPAGVGDRTLVAGFPPHPGWLSAFTVQVRFRLQGDLIEPAGTPKVADSEPQSLSHLRTLLEPEK